MAWNGLVKKLKNGFKKAVFIGTAFSVLGSSCCKCPVPTPTPNNPPTATLIVNPTSGDAPLETIIQLDGADRDGKSDIIEYKIGEDKNNDGDIDDYGETITQSSNPIIDYPVTFTASGIKKIYGQVMDSQAAVGKDGPILVDVASVLDWPEGFDPSINEEKERTIILPSEDKGGNPVSYTYATPQDSSQFEVVSLSGNELTLKGDIDKIGDYQINLEFESSGKTYYETLEGFIYDCLDVEGQLQDNETDSSQKGIIKVYNNLPTPAFLGETETDANGDFSVQVNERVSGLSGIIVQAGIDNNGNDILESYVRTRTFPSGDIRDLVIKAVPYPTQDLNGIGTVNAQDYIDFKEHVAVTNPGLTPDQGLRKWNLDDIIGIEILCYNPVVSGSGMFMPADQIFIKNKIQDSDDIESYVENKIHFVENPSGGNERLLQIDDTGENQNENARYRINDANQVIPNPQWIVVVPDSLPGGSAKVWDTYRVLTQGVININPGVLVYGSHTLSHEFLHIFAAPDDYYNTPLSGDVTVLKTGSSLTAAGLADKKQAKIVYEDNHQAQEKLDDIMALNFLNN